MRRMSRFGSDALIHTGTASTAANASANPAAMILVIDSSLLARMQIQALVRGAGYQPRLAASAAQARASIAVSIPDLIILELALPNESGLELLRDLRRNPATARLPIIAHSALASDAHIDAGLAQGADDYLTKPADMRTVLARIQEWLGLD